MKKTAIITFDYEVFLGRHTGTVENSVIKPTQSIIQILRDNNAKAIFFVDATWLLFLKENFSNDFQIVSGQLKTIVESGSSVELHLHPQWLKAEKTDQGIVFNNGNELYKLHSLSNEEISDLFRRSKELLERITNTPVRSFRAGGWCIEPFDQIRIAFESSNIKYDFSIAPGMYLREGKVYDFDYSKAPRLPFYRFQNDIQKPVTGGKFTELTVSTYRNNPIYRLVNKIILKIKKDQILGDGKGIKEKSIFSIRAFYSRLIFSYGMLTVDKTSSLLFRYLLSTHLRKDNFLVVISHPKTVSKQAFRNLLHLTKKYNTLNSSGLEKYLENL